MGGNNANLLQDIRASKNKLTLSSQTIAQAHASFDIQSAEFFALVEQLESKFKELEERETKVEKREQEMGDKTQQLQERERKYTEREQKIEAREKEVSDKETKWNETEKKMQQNAAKIPTYVRLSVSGTRFEIAKDKLLQHKGSLLERMISSDHPPLNSSGEIFIERDPHYFSFIVRSLLGSAIITPNNPIDQKAINAEFEYFQIPYNFSEVDSIPGPAQHTLIDDNTFLDKIKEWLPTKKFQILYKASLDGFAAAEFHKRCDNKGPTLTVICSTNNYLFGGYTPYHWSSTTQGYKNGPDGFIFTLTNPHNIPPTKYSRNLEHQEAIFCHSTYGPTFGGGYDLYVADNSNQNTTSYTNFPFSYTDTTGKEEFTFHSNNNTSQHFTAAEIEVFLVL